MSFASVRDLLGK